MHQPPCQYLRYRERNRLPISVSSCRYKIGQSPSTSLYELGIVATVCRLFLVKLIIAFPHSGKSEFYFLMFRAFSVCQHKAILSYVTEGGASDYDGEKEPST